MSPLPGITELPLAMARSLRYGDQVLSGEGRFQISIIGPKYDGMKIQLMAFDGCLYCPSVTGIEDLYVKLPSGVKNIEKVADKYYSNVYYDLFWYEGKTKILVGGRSKTQTWDSIANNDMYDGIIVTHLGTEYKIKKTRTYDLKVSKLGLEDAHGTLVFAKTYPAQHIGKIVECSIIVDGSKVGPQFKVLKTRDDKIVPEVYSPFITEMHQFVPYVGVLYQGITHAQFRFAPCCGGLDGDVHAVSCLLGQRKASLVPIPSYIYVNGYYVNFDPATTDVDYDHTYVTALGNITIRHSSSERLFSESTMKILDFIAFKYPEVRTDIKSVDSWLLQRGCVGRESGPEISSRATSVFVFDKNGFLSYGKDHAEIMALVGNYGEVIRSPGGEQYITDGTHALHLTKDVTISVIHKTCFPCGGQIASTGELRTSRYIGQLKVSTPYAPPIRLNRRVAFDLAYGAHKAKERFKVLLSEGGKVVDWERMVVRTFKDLKWSQYDFKDLSWKCLDDDLRKSAKDDETRIKALLLTSSIKRSDTPPRKKVRLENKT